jgi:hypothetical protein
LEQAMVSAKYTDAELKGEPTLEEIFADPIIQLIMQRDGVRAHDMRNEMDRMVSLYAEQLSA